MPESQVAHRPNAGVRMKRANRCVDQAPTVAITTSLGAGREADADALVSDRARGTREAVRARQPLRAFDAGAIGKLSRTAQTDPAHLRRTGSSCRSSERTWTAMHRWPPDSERHRRGTTSSAIGGNVCESTDKGSA
jgi:hypothetical protein